MSQNPSSSPGTGPSIDSLVKTIDSIESQLKEYQQSQRRTGRIIAVGSLALIAVMVIFMLNLYRTGREKLTQDQVREALFRQAKLLEPELRSQIETAAKEIIPAYMEAAQQQMAKDWPVIQAKLAEKSQQFPTEIQKMLVTDGQAMLDRVEKHLEGTLKKEFPGLTEEHAHKAAEALLNHTALKSEKLHDKLQAISDKEQARLYKVLEKYPIADYASYERSTLEKKVLRLALKAVDYELEVHGTKDGLDLEELQKQGIIGTSLELNKIGTDK